MCCEFLFGLSVGKIYNSFVVCSTGFQGTYFSEYRLVDLLFIFILAHLPALRIANVELNPYRDSLFIKYFLT